MISGEKSGSVADTSGSRGGVSPVHGPELLYKVLICAI